MSVYFSVSHLGHLSALEVHALYKLRVDVFVHEQQCPYAEIDDHDAVDTTMHIRATEGRRLVGCARVYPDTWKEFAAEAGLNASVGILDATTPVAHFGRFVVAPDHRGTGLGTQLLSQALRMCEGQFPGQPVVLSAQAVLESYYGEHGFVRCGDVVVLDGQPHVPMIKPATGEEQLPR